MCGGYQPMAAPENETTEEIEPKPDKLLKDNERESQMIRGDNLPIVDLRKYKTEEKFITFK